MIPVSVQRLLISLSDRIHDLSRQHRDVLKAAGVSSPAAQRSLILELKEQGHTIEQIARILGVRGRRVAHVLYEAGK